MTTFNFLHFLFNFPLQSHILYYLIINEYLAKVILILGPGYQLNASFIQYGAPEPRLEFWGLSWIQQRIQMMIFLSFKLKIKESIDCGIILLKPLKFSKSRLLNTLYFLFCIVLFLTFIPQLHFTEPDDEIEILNVVASPSRLDASRPGPYRPYTSPQPGPSRSYPSPKPGPSRSYPSSHPGPSRSHPIPQSPDIPSPSQPSSSFLPPKKRLSNSILPDSQSLEHSAQSPIRNTQSPILNVQSAQLESQSLLKIQSPHVPSDNHDNLLDSPLGLDEDPYQLPDIPDPVEPNSCKFIVKFRSG